MKEQLISIIIALIFALFGVLLGLQFPDDFRAVDSLYLGLFAYLTTTAGITLWNSAKLKKFNKLLSEVAYIANHLRIQDSAIRSGSRAFDLFWAISLLRAKEGIYSLLDSGDFIINKEQAPKFWLQAIINTDSTWLATNVVGTQLDWQSGWENKGIKYQRFVNELSNITIKRIFIYEKTSDINDVQIAIMKEHQDNNIQVRWVAKDLNNLHWAPFDMLDKSVGTEDIVLIDNNYLLLFNLLENKSLESIKCTNNETSVSSVNDIYIRLWEEARLLSDL